MTGDGAGEAAVPGGAASGNVVVMDCLRGLQLEKRVCRVKHSRVRCGLAIVFLSLHIRVKSFSVSGSTLYI